jgi:hypothetical protein
MLLLKIGIKFKVLSVKLQSYEDEQRKQKGGGFRQS